QIAVDRLGEAFRHGLVFLLDALVLGREERGDALGPKEDQGADPDHEEADTDIPAQAMDRGAAAIGRRRAHIAVTARSLQLCAVLRYVNVSNARLARPAPLAWGDAPNVSNARLARPAPLAWATPRTSQTLVWHVPRHSRGATPRRYA